MLFETRFERRGRSLARSAGASLVFLCAVTVPEGATVGRQTDRPCEGRLNGEEFPFLIPEYVVWKEIFRTGQGTEADASLQLTEAGRRSLQAIESMALDRGAAEVILEARDDLLRALSSSDSKRLMEHVDSRRRQTRFTFEKAGRRTAVQGSRIPCVISIDGRQQPQLIPEAYYWEFYFRTLATVSEQNRIGVEAYSADYLRALRQHHLPISEHDVITVLRTATETRAQIDTARAAYRDSKDAEPAVAAIVQTARLKLLRTLPRESWLIVQRDAARVRVGTTYDFPIQH